MSNAEIYIALVAYASFIVTSLTGALGGMMLLATMALYFPLSIMIPLHAVIHLSGDLGRIVPAIRHVALRPTTVFCFWTLLGVGVGFFFYLSINKTMLLVFVSLYILLITWLSNRAIAKLAQVGYGWLGLFMGYLSITVGAPGPLHLARLQAEFEDAVTIVTTAAAFTAFINIVKLGLFASVGFDFSQYSGVLIVGSISAILGSMTGVVIRTKFTQAFKSKMLIKVSITIAVALIQLKLIVP